MGSPESRWSDRGNSLPGASWLADRVTRLPRAMSHWSDEVMWVRSQTLYTEARRLIGILDLDKIKRGATGDPWPKLVGWLCWGLTSQSTIFQSYRDGAIASWVINQYFRGVKCLAQGHNTAAVGLEPRTSRSGVRHSTTEPPRSPRDQSSTVHKFDMPGETRTTLYYNQTK